MKKACWSVLLAFFCTFWWICPASACRYNVRETGFVDLGMEPYVLCGYIDGNTPADVSAAFKRIPDAAFAESNVIFRLIDTDKQKDHPAIKHLDPNTQSLPCATLVSPDGQTLPISVSKAGEPFAKTLGSAVDNIISSAKRDELLREVAKMYGVVVVIEGPDAEENDKAKKAALAAVEAVTSQMEYMPKEISNPPSLLVIDSNCLEDEKILLWSLGLEPKDVNEVLAIVVYGKARWIGPLFRGDRMNEDDLASILSVVGADCECGLDYRWLQGTMLPAKWDAKIHALVVESLGFDPESPMIKMEISSIIGRGMGGRGYPSTAYGYQELIIEPEADVDEVPAEVVIEPNVVAATVEEANDVTPARVPDDAMPIDATVGKDHPQAALEAATPVNGYSTEKSGDPGTVHEPNAVRSAEKPKVGMPEPNLVRTMLQEKARQDAPGEDDIYRPMRSTALLVIGLFALVVIFGVAILARARRA